MTWKSEIKSEIIDNGYDLGYFTLQEFYRSSLRNLQSKFPKNNTCQASIQGTLQNLRDDGFLKFLGKGRYKVISEENDEWIVFMRRYHEYLS